jgi:serine/threonine protein kinase/tetratricopeptide (TPR) repeat protein
VTPERWKQIKAAFQTAADLNSGERTAFLDQVCAGDPELRKQVESLLHARDEAGDFIEAPALDPFAGGRVGAYRLIRKLGQGGMGTVYLAARADGQFEHRVAVKIVKRGMDTDFILDRFRNERQILASLDHPNIGRLLDGGATEDGLPYFVMELIEGEPIDDYCDGLRLSTPARLKLFCIVCGAVHYAHRNRVVHRDIKPGNILISAEGTPKLLDFGIAKILDSSDSSDATATSLRVMTPAYSSPEQIRGETITPASDIYSLGVLLYELLTGQRPYQLKGRAPHEVAQVICEEPPSRPSIAVSRTTQITTGDGTTVTITPESVSRTRDCEPASLRRTLAGDLDSIVLQALRKEPEERYASAEDLSEDVRRYLEGLPVRARKDSAVYRFGKFVRRRVGAAVAVSVCVVSLGVGAYSWRARLAADSVDHGQAARNRLSVAVIGFRNLSDRPEAAWLGTALSEMMSTELASGEKLRAIPGESVSTLKLELAIDDAESFGKETLRRIHNNLGADYVVAGSYFAPREPGKPIRVDIRLQDTTAGETVASIADTTSEGDLAVLVGRTGAQLREKLGAGRVSSSALRASLPANPEAVRYYSEGLNKLRFFDAIAARDLLQKAAGLDPRHALTHSALALALTSLGDDGKAKAEAKLADSLSAGLPREERLFVEGQYHETTGSWDKAADSYRALFGFFPDSLDYGLRLAAAQTAGGKAKESLRTLDELRKLPPPAAGDPRIDLEEAYAAAAISDFERQRAAAARAAERGIANGSRILVGNARVQEGIALGEMGQQEKAGIALQEARRIYTEAGHRRGESLALSALASTRMRLGDLENASRLHQESLAISRRIGNKTGIARSLNSLAVILKQRGDYEGAKKLYREALALRREAGDRGGLAAPLNNLANALLEQGELTEAKQLYGESLAIARESGERRAIARALHNLALVLYYQGDLAGAKGLNQESITIRREINDVSGLAMAHHSVADVLIDQGDLVAAKQAAEEALADMRKTGNKRGVTYALSALGKIASASDLVAASRLHQEALALRVELKAKNTEAESWLLLAKIALQEGRLQRAAALARQAADEFHRERAVHTELEAQSVVVLTLAAQGRIADAQRLLDKMKPELQNLEFRRIRIACDMAAMRVAFAAGRRDEAMRSLEALLLETIQLGFLGIQFDIRLMLGDIEKRSGETQRGVGRLMALEREAEAKGFQLVARKAAAARQ